MASPTNPNTTSKFALVLGGLSMVAVLAAVSLRSRNARSKQQEEQQQQQQQHQQQQKQGSTSIRHSEHEEPEQHRPVRVPVSSDVREPTSFANFQDCIVSHIDLDLKVHFDRQVLGGSVVLTAEVKRDGVDVLVLDTRKLSVQAVKLADGARGSRDLEYSFGVEHSAFGTPLRISLPPDTRARGTKLQVQIAYETAAGSECSATQWLAAEQTAGKMHPYLFTQCQAIHCRSMVPCQDAPACKVTYNASITTPDPLVALMSAVATHKTQLNNCQSVYHFRQAIPMSAYLIALAVGNLESRDIGPRTRVWSEPNVVDFGAFEFADTERFLCAAEQICGPYVWGRYDLLLLPPSFPYGGMENPCLTFVTPTLLAGDRSLANVVAHEIAHSWMGNGITCVNWGSFWLNEGFTVFVERRIIAKVFGEQRAGLQSAIGWQHLEEAVDHFGADHEFTCLHIEMKDVDPDDSFSSIPYEKGCAFLTYLEQLLGGPAVFEPYLKAHVQRFQFGTVSELEFKEFFLSFFEGIAPETLGQIDWETWLHAPGMPKVKPTIDTTLIQIAVRSADEWLDAGKSRAIPEWSSDEKVVFLEYIIKRVTNGDTAVSKELFHAIDAAYSFSSTKNAEIRFRWCTLGIKLQFEEVFPLAIKLLTEQGRMKFVRPLFRDLYKSGGEKGKELALRTFVERRSSYHAICQKMVAKDLNVDL